MDDSKKTLADICEMKEELTEFVMGQISDGLHGVDTDELGKAVDMIKDLADAEKLAHEACYYKKVTEAMGDHDHDDDDEHHDPYSKFREARRRYSKTHSQEDKERMTENATAYLSNAMTSIQEIYEAADPDLKKRMKMDLTKLASEMTM